MAAYNMVAVPQERRCPKCDHWTRHYVQFHYGSQTLRDYQIGERLEWDRGNDEGESGHTKVAVHGYNHGCQHCGYFADAESELRIDIENDVIVSVTPDDGEIDYLSQGHYYWVVLED
jgi:hypothetical protein